MACSKAQGVANGQTTICFRNIPNSYDGKKIETELLSVVSGTYDFIYVPHDFKRLPKLNNVGYFFVNFTSPEVAAEAWDKLDGFMQWTVKSDKKLEAVWADKTQGLGACHKKFKNAPILHHDVPDICKPLVLQNGSFVPLVTKKKNLIRPRNVPAHATVGQQVSDAAMEAPVEMPPGDVPKASCMCSTAGCQEPSWNREPGEYCSSQCRDSVQQAITEPVTSSTPTEPCETDLDTNCFACGAEFGFFCWPFRCQTCSLGFCRRCSRQALTHNHCSTCFGADEIKYTTKNTTIHVVGGSYDVPDEKAFTFPM